MNQIKIDKLYDLLEALGKDEVFEAYKKSLKELSKVQLYWEAKLLGGKIQIALDFDNTPPPTGIRIELGSGVTEENIGLNIPNTYNLEHIIG